MMIVVLAVLVVVCVSCSVVDRTAEDASVMLLLSSTVTVTISEDSSVTVTVLPQVAASAI